MQGVFKAVIFDMDGVLIDSEPLWRRAMILGFTGTGMPFNEDDCHKTMGLRIGEVVQHWLDYHQLKSVNATELEFHIVSILLDLIAAEGRLIPGIDAILALCGEKNIRMGLATSSSHLLMGAILKKLALTETFDAAISAEHMTYGKPHPEVFLTCAAQLKTAPAACLVIEDSLNGVIAAKAAQMTVIAVPEDLHQRKPGFVIADHCLNDMHAVLALFKTLWP